MDNLHARIGLQADGLWIEDLGSTNGTFVNGEKVKRARLSEGDRVAADATVLRCDDLLLDESLLTNKGVHTESGDYSVRDWLNSYIKHPVDHANQIIDIID